MEKKNTLYVNLYGAPGSGKSTTAAKVFGCLKDAGISVELVREYAKELVWEGINPSEYGQYRVACEQVHRELSLDGKVDVVVTDSPWSLSGYYGSKYGGKLWNPILYLGYEHLFDGRWEVNFFLQRTKPFKKDGRLCDEKGSDKTSKELLEFLDGHRKAYQKVTSHSYKRITDHVCRMLKEGQKND